jgi:hypothetical protein
MTRQTLKLYTGLCRPPTDLSDYVAASQARQSDGRLDSSDCYWLSFETILSYSDQQLTKGKAGEVGKFQEKIFPPFFSS